LLKSNFLRQIIAEGDNQIGHIMVKQIHSQGG